MPDLQGRMLGAAEDGPPDVVAHRATVEALEDLVDRIAGTARWIARAP